MSSFSAETCSYDATLFDLPIYSHVSVFLPLSSVVHFLIDEDKWVMGCDLLSVVSKFVVPSVMFMFVVMFFVCRVLKLSVPSCCSTARFVLADFVDLLMFVRLGLDVC